MSPLAALQRTLAGEHAAVYVYGVLGARVPGDADAGLASRMSRAYITHRGRRDQLTAMVRRAGGDPVPAAVGYELAGADGTPSQLDAAAVVTEQRCAAVYAAGVGATAGADRQWMIAALTDAAVRLLSFGGRPSAFPGAPEL